MPTADTIAQTLPFYLWDSTAVDTTQVEHEVNLGIPLDSIFPAIDRPLPQQRQSLFTHHGMPVQHEQPVARHDNAVPAWTFVLLLLLTVLTFVYYNARKIKLTELLKSTIDSHATDRLVRSSNMGRTSVLVPVGLLIAATLAMAVYQVAMAHTGIGGYLLLTQPGDTSARQCLQQSGLGGNLYHQQLSLPSRARHRRSAVALPAGVHAMGQYGGALFYCRPHGFGLRNAYSQGH